MKYLMIDTNIYIDMMVSRNGSHKPESYSELMKLLDYGEIKIIVPKIVITEVFRHINNEIDKVGRSISEMKTKAKGLYWINHGGELEKFNKSLKTIKTSLNGLINEFNSNNENYKSQYKELFNKLFDNDNCIVLEEDEKIVFKATQRKVHKMRPFHYGGKDNDKDSMADAIIIETLINIEDLINIDVSDKIYFISRNPVDFSDSEDENLLHNDISSSLEVKGVRDKINYRLLFTKTLLQDFKDEIELAGLTEQLELEAEYEMKADIQRTYDLQDDFERESAGLSSLSTDYEEVISELNIVTELMGLLEEMKSEIRRKCDDFYDAYYSLEEVISNKSLQSLQEIIDKNQLIKIMIENSEDEDEIKDKVKYLINWLVGDEEYANFGEKFSGEDVFSLNTTLTTFRDASNNEYILESVGYINPANDDEDNVYIKLYKGDKLLEEGEISIYYGYINYNDDGNVDDGAEESIKPAIDNIISRLLDIKESIIIDLDSRILKSKELIEALS